MKPIVVVAVVALSALCANANLRVTTSSSLGDRARCEVYSGLPEGWGKDAHAGMARMAGGDFEFGSERGYANERPMLMQHIQPFWMDRTEVTNAQFARFVSATAYVTETERGKGAAVFRAPDLATTNIAPGSWWHLEKDADWRHPEGPASSITGREHEPVVNVSHADAAAYARWLGHALPDEAQWEFAAKSGRTNAAADRGLRDFRGRPLQNFWQGLFPLHNSAEDGYPGRAPVGCFPANAFGLQDMVGNVWEWTTDFYLEGHAGGLNVDTVPASLQQGRAASRVIKGGSFLCSDNYCVRARASSRQGQEADLPASHLGFRTISAFD